MAESRRRPRRGPIRDDFFHPADEPLLTERHGDGTVVDARLAADRWRVRITRGGELLYRGELLLEHPSEYGPDAEDVATLRAVVDEQRRQYGIAQAP